MTEIITLGVGSSGSKMAFHYWNYILQEHQINTNGSYVGNEHQQNSLLGHANVLLNETQNKYVPRALFIDSDSKILNSLQMGNLNSLFNPNSYQNLKGGGSNNFAVGFYHLGDCINETLDNVRKIIELCDSCHAIQLFHSISGGIGAGYGSLLLSHLIEQFPEIIYENYTNIMSTKEPQSVVEPYNTTFSISSLVENSSTCHLFQNYSLNKYCKRNWDLFNPSFDDYNLIISGIASGISSSMRFRGIPGGNLRKLAVNLIPFPRLHFFADTYCTFHNSILVSEDILAEKLFSLDFETCSANFKELRVLTGGVVARGSVSAEEVQHCLSSFKNMNSEYFKPWIPDNFHLCYSSIDNPRNCASGIGIFNTQGIREILRQIAEQLTAMFRRKAFLHWYTREGMDEMEFTEAESNMNDLVSEYMEYGTPMSLYEEDEEDEFDE